MPADLKRTSHHGEATRRLLQSRTPASWRALLAVGLLTLLGACSRTPVREQRSEPHMGTQFSVVLYNPLPRNPQTALQPEPTGQPEPALQPEPASQPEPARETAAPAFDRISELDALLSDYRADSEIRLLAAHGEDQPTGWVPASQDLIDVLTLAHDVSDRSGGAFDVSVGALTRIWRRAFLNHELRTGWQDDLTEIRAQAVDWRAIQIDPEHNQIQLSKAGMRLDLGGIAKGYALDEALIALKQNGINAALVDGGGDVAVMGHPPGRDHWIVTIEDPFGNAETPPTRLQVPSGAICSSGDLYRYSEIGGVRYSHLVDPRSGMALTSRIHVTVWAPTGALADALASALSVLGTEAGIELAESWPRVEARISTLKGDQRIETETSAFDSLLIH